MWVAVVRIVLMFGQAVFHTAGVAAEKRQQQVQVQQWVHQHHVEGKL